MNKTQTAKALGIAAKTLNDTLRAMGWSTDKREFSEEEIEELRAARELADKTHTLAEVRTQYQGEEEGDAQEEDDGGDEDETLADIAGMSLQQMVATEIRDAFQDGTDRIVRDFFKSELPAQIVITSFVENLPLAAASIKSFRKKIKYNQLPYTVDVASQIAGGNGTEEDDYSTELNNVGEVDDGSERDMPEEFKGEV